MKSPMQARMSGAPGLAFETGEAANLAQHPPLKIFAVLLEYFCFYCRPWVPHPFRVFQRNGWDTDEVPACIIPENALSNSFRAFLLLAATLIAAPTLCAQTAPASGPIAIIPLNNKNPDAAATVTGALEVSQGKAVIVASGAVTSGSQTTEVALPRRGTLRVCATTTVKLAADTSVPVGETPGLMMAMDHGAVEMSFAASVARGRNADILMTPDFRILIGGVGAADVKVRLGQHGDTCVENGKAPGDNASSLGSGAATDAPYVLVTGIFDSGDYRVQSGQRVMFQHGSLHEVVDNEKEPCGCPPAEPKGNEFPLAQSEGLAPLPQPAPSAIIQTSAPPQVVEPLIYKSPAPLPASEAAPAAAITQPAKPPAKKKQGFFGGIGKFFRRLFGAE